MEENSLPPGNSVSPAATEYLDSADSAPVSSYAAPTEWQPENLEVHSESGDGLRVQTEPTSPAFVSVPFSRRRATIVSLIITLLVMEPNLT